MEYILSNTRTLGLIAYDRWHDTMNVMLHRMPMSYWSEHDFRWQLASASNSAFAMLDDGIRSDITVTWHRI
jgi:hypothetical protein